MELTNQTNHSSLSSAARQILLTIVKNCEEFFNSGTKKKKNKNE